MSRSKPALLELERRINLSFAIPHGEMWAARYERFGATHKVFSSPDQVANNLAGTVGANMATQAKQDLVAIDRAFSESAAGPAVTKSFSVTPEAQGLLVHEQFSATFNVVAPKSVTIFAANWGVFSATVTASYGVTETVSGQIDLLVTKSTITLLASSGLESHFVATGSVAAQAGIGIWGLNLLSVKGEIKATFSADARIGAMGNEVIYTAGQGAIPAQLGSTLHIGFRVDATVSWHALFWGGSKTTTLVNATLLNATKQYIVCF